jgi:hypothetical protein
MSLELNQQLFLQVMMNKQMIEENELSSIVENINQKYESKKKNLHFFPQSKIS